MRSLLFSWAFVVGCGVTDPSLDVTTSALDGTIRVSAYRLASDTPSVGTEVQFIAPDDSVQTVITDANGVAEAVSAPNTRVVVFQDWMVRIFYAANPGDHIISGFRRPPREPDLGTIRFEMLPRPGWNMNHFGVHYVLHVSCSLDHGVSFQPLHDVRVVDCPHATNATAVGWLEEAGTGKLLTGASVLRDIDLTAHIGKTIRMPAYWPKLMTASAQFVNTPPGMRLGWGTAAHYGEDPKTFAFGWTYDAQPNVLNTRPSLGIGERTLSTLELASPYNGSVYHLQVDEGFAPNYFVDADASRRMHHISWGRFNAYSQTISWHPASDGQPPSMVFGHLLVFAAGSRFYQIEIYAPGDTSSVKLPSLPAAVTPQLNDSIHARAVFYRISNETYSEWLQAHSSRDPYAVSSWSSEMPREVWLSFAF